MSYERERESVCVCTTTGVLPFAPFLHIEQKTRHAKHTLQQWGGGGKNTTEDVATAHIKNMARQKAALK